LRLLDSAISGREDKLSQDDLCRHLLLRRIEFTGKSEEEMRALLKRWMQLASSIPPGNLSLYLHLPVLYSTQK